MYLQISIQEGGRLRRYAKATNVPSVQVSLDDLTVIGVKEPQPPTRTPPVRGRSSAPGRRWAAGPLKSYDLRPRSVNIDVRKGWLPPRRRSVRWYPKLTYVFVSGFGQTGPLQDTRT